jgi:hypothetical protein
MKSQLMVYPNIRQASSYNWVAFISVTNQFPLATLQYAWTLITEPTPTVTALFELAKRRLPTALETKLAEFPSAIIDTHGKDLTVSADISRSGTPAPPGPTAASSSAPANPSKPAQPMKPLNTSKVTAEATFMARADDIFGLLTDEKRIPMWTRASAQVEYFRFFAGFPIFERSCYDSPKRK